MMQTCNSHPMHIEMLLSLPLRVLWDRLCSLEDVLDAFLAMCHCHSHGHGPCRGLFQGGYLWDHTSLVLAGQMQGAEI